MLKVNEQYPAFQGSGLDCRAYIATQAMIGYMSMFSCDSDVPIPSPDNAAHWAVKYADALIKELNK